MNRLIEEFETELSDMNIFHKLNIDQIQFTRFGCLNCQGYQQFDGLCPNCRNIIEDNDLFKEIFSDYLEEIEEISSLNSFKNLQLFLINFSE